MAPRKSSADRAALPLTTNQGLTVTDNQHSLRAGLRGPTLLEDFQLREKITHFDHERIPERVVHARGSGAHGYFECTRDCSDWTRAGFLGEVGRRTPVFARFSTVAGGSGSADTPRDVRGFAVKFKTLEGNFDLVGNNLPVFFVQDAMKFPDLVHALKMEPDRGFPQASSAHDTFWDFIGLMPESMHMILWAMSDRTLPRSLRMMDGFGVHTFRLVSAQGRVRFVKFHWRAALGVQSTTWDEAVKIAGADPDFHRRDLWEAIDRGYFPAWDLGLQVFDEDQAQRWSFDVLDPTKLVPEELAPVVSVGRMVLDRNPDNFFAETEMVAFCPAHLVPGIDVSEDPLLQGRLFSYTDTQLSRLGGPNFHQLPVNRPACPVRNFQRDARMQGDVPSGRVAYEPNSLAAGGPREQPEAGPAPLPVPLEGCRRRARPAAFTDHYSQARQFFRSLAAPEQRHVVAALAFELGKVSVASVRRRMLTHLMTVDRSLACGVLSRLGEAVSPDLVACPAFVCQDLPRSEGLSALHSRAGSLQGRHVAVLVLAGVDGDRVDAAIHAVQKAGARCSLVAPTLAGVLCAAGQLLAADAALVSAPSCLFDAVAVLGAGDAVAALQGNPAVQSWLRDAWRHLKTIGLDAAGRDLARAVGLGQDAAVVAIDAPGGLDQWLDQAARGKFFDREGAPGTDV